MRSWAVLHYWSTSSSMTPPMTNDQGDNSLELLLYIMRGTRPGEPPKQRGERLREGRPEPRRQSRPQLKSSHVVGLHSLKTRDVTEMGNDVIFWELIRACGHPTSENLKFHYGSLIILLGRRLRHTVPLWRHSRSGHSRTERIFRHGKWSDKVGYYECHSSHVQD